MKKKLYTLELNSDELWFLMSLFGPAYVLGMENPHHGWLAEETEKADRKAINALVERDLIEAIPEEDIKVDDALLSVIEACVHPEHSLIVYSQTADGKNKERYIHFFGDQIVEHIESESGIHQLTTFSSREALEEHLKDDLRFSSQTSSKSPPFYITEETLFSASRLYAEGKVKKARAILDELSLDPTVVQALDDVFRNPIANSSFVVIANQKNPETQHVRGFGILEGKTEFWLMCPTERMGQHQVEFDPASAKIAHQRLVEILP